MPRGDCKTNIILPGCFLFILFGCPCGRIDPISQDPYKIRHSILIANTAPQEKKDNPYLYFQNITILGFSADYSVEEKLYICKALDTIEVLLNLDDFKILLEEVVFLEKDPSPPVEEDIFTIDQCGINYIIPEICKKIPLNRPILNTRFFLQSLQETSKKFSFYKKIFSNKNTVAIASIGGEEIIWNSEKFSPITELELSFVIITLFHEMMHSFGYEHSTRIPYAATKVLSTIYKRYERTHILQNLVGKFQRLHKKKFSITPTKVVSKATVF